MNDSAPAAVLVSPSAGRIYRRLLGYAAPHWGMFGIGVLGMALYAATDASTAWLVREFLNTTFFQHNPQALWFIPVAIIVLFFLRGVGDYVATYFPGWVGRQIIKSMRAELFAHYLRLPAMYYDSASSAQMLSRMTYNVELVAEASTNSVTVLIRDSLTIVGLLGWLFYLDWQLTLIALTLAPLISFLLQRVNRLFRRYSARIQNSMGDVTRVAKEAIEGHRVIRVFNAQDYEQRAFDVVNEQNRHSNMRLVGARASSGPIVQLIAAIGLAVVMYFAIRQVLSHAMPVADFLSFLAGLLLISAPLRRLMPVSYTHLDVYKRQEGAWGAAQPGARFCVSVPSPAARVLGAGKRGDATTHPTHAHCRCARACARAIGACRFERSPGASAAPALGRRAAARRGGAGARDTAAGRACG